MTPPDPIPGGAKVQRPAQATAVRPARGRPVDLWRSDEADLWGALIVAGEGGYDVVALAGEPAPAQRQHWPRALFTPDWESPPELRAQQWLPLGDGGPVTWRRLDVAVRVDGDHIRHVQAAHGRLAGGLSRLARRHTYNRLAVLAESLNEQAPAAMALATVLAVEALCDIEPPPACQHLRVAVAEISRLQSHLAWLGMQAAACGDDGLLAETRQGREALARLFVELCGRRRPTGIHHPGRICIDLPAGRAAWPAARDGIGRLVSGARRVLVGCRSWRRRLRGAGHLDPSAATQGLASGPVARASGVEIDVRLRHPYLTYDQLEVEAVLASEGDVVARSQVRLQEMDHSLALVTRALGAAQGPLAITDPRIAPPAAPVDAAAMMHHFELWMEGHGLQPPPGRSVFVGTEAPEGEFGVLLSSDGSGKPRRAHWRSPSFFHFQLLPQVLQGQRFSDAPDVVASFNINAAEMDR